MHEMQTVVTDVRPSVCLSRMHQMTPHGEANSRLGFTMRGHLVQPLPNHCGHLFYFLFRLQK